MNDSEFLKRIFAGYVLTYRANLWHKNANYHDMTSNELQFFTQLGRSLGYNVRREMNWDYPRDLCWCESESGAGCDMASKTVLCLERENQNARVLDNTIKKLLNPDNARSVPYLVAVLGWVRRNTLEEAKNIVRSALAENQSFLCISWVGESPDGDFEVEGWVRNQGIESTCAAQPKIDEAGYWYMQRQGEWS